MTIGILHTEYLQHGGEDQVVQAEAQLLETDPSIEVKVLKLKNPSTLIKQVVTLLLLPFNPLSFFKIYRWIKAENIEVLHVHNWMFAASPSVFWAAKAAGIPVVYTLHNYRMLCPSATLFFNGKLFLSSLDQEFSWSAVAKGAYNKSKVLTFWVALCIWLHKKAGTWKMIDKYILLTRHSEEVLAKSKLDLKAEQLTVKPNFTYLAEPEKTSGRTDRFLFIGRLSEEKGIHTLLDAFSRSNYAIDIVGTGPLKEEVEAYAERYQNINYLGFRDKAGIFRYLRECTALVFPSVWYETFGLTIIEAFANSTPVIASKIGSAAYLIRNGYNGIHFDSGSSESLIEKIDYWAGLAEKEKSRFRENAKNSYKEFSPEQNRKELKKIYSSLLHYAPVLQYS